MIFSNSNVPLLRVCQFNLVGDGWYTPFLCHFILLGYAGTDGQI